MCGDGAYRFKMDSQKLEEFLRVGFPSHRPLCLETGEPLDIEHHMVSNVFPAAQPELISLKKAMKATMVPAGTAREAETEAARNNLITMKQKKQTLEAEVRFLRRRHKFLLKTNSSSAQEVKYQNIETTQYRKSKKEKVNPKKATTLPILPPIPNLNPRNNMFSKKKNFVPSRLTPVFDSERNVDLHGFNINQRFHGNNLSLRSEFNQKESGFSGKEAVVQTRGPKFDLNRISKATD